MENSGSILVIDDNPLIARGLELILKRESFDVTVCIESKSALERLKQKDFDLVICDVMMPHLGGFDLHKSVREDPTFAHIPFVFLSGLSAPEDLNRGMESGVDEYMVKPFDATSLLSVVKGKIVRSKGLKRHIEEERDVFRKKIFQTLSHEFKTPLVAINTGAELLKDGKNLKEDKINHLITAIHRGGKRLERMVNDFISLQQIDAGYAGKQWSDHKKRTELKYLASGVTSYLENVLSEEEFERISIKTREDALAQNPLELYLPQIYDAVSRLVDNAVKFSQTLEGEVSLIFDTDEFNAIIVVQDRGIGCQVSKLEEKIKLFNQVNRDELEQQGSGAGLAIANHYVAINGGKLTFRERKNGGFEAKISLPFTR